MTSAESVKEGNEAFLRQLGVAVNTALPCIESLDEISPRSATEVAQQLIAVFFMVNVGHGYPVASAREDMLALGLSDVLGSTSREILSREPLSERDKIALSWQAEGLQSLAWALNLAQLDHTRLCDDNLFSCIPARELASQFIATAKLRPLSEIQEQVDLIYRMHWAVVNTRFTGGNPDFNESVIRERRRALDWIYGVDDDWDEIPLDT
jgi:hypothetical protein